MSWATLLADFGDVPSLHGAACRGRSELFDAAGRWSDHTLAITTCQHCPALLACARWVEDLPAWQRPSGIVAARFIAAPSSASGRPPGRPKTQR